MSHLRYESYKDSGVEWLGEVPEHWEVKRLRFLLSMNPSKTEIGEAPDNQKVSFLPMEAVGEDGSLNLETEREIKDVLNGYTYFAEGDITFAKITPCFENGKGAVMQGLKNGFGFGTTELTVMRPTGKNLSTYLWYVTKSLAFRRIGESYMYGAGGQKRVPDDFVRNFTWAAPPLPEQKSIASYLARETSRIDSLISEQKELIALLKEKRQALISHTITKGLDPDVTMKDSGVEWLGMVPEHWEVKRLKYLGDAITGLTYSPNDIVDEEYQGNKKLVLRSTNIQDRRISLHENVFVSCKIPKELLTQFGDILICSRNGSRNLVGKNAMITALEQMTFGAFTTVFRSKHNDFLFYVFNSELFEHQSSGFLTTTINQLTIGNLNSMVVPLPPLPEQQSIASYLDKETSKIDNLIKEAESTIILMQEHRAALISAAVTGKIKVPDVVAEV